MSMFAWKFRIAVSGSLIRTDLAFSQSFSGAKMRRLLPKEGTGLGLVIVKEILDFLNGRIQVESEWGRALASASGFPASEWFPWPEKIGATV